MSDTILTLVLESFSPLLLHKLTLSVERLEDVFLDCRCASMSSLVRDSAFGQLVRFVSGRRLFQYPEEKYPFLWEKYVNVEKSVNIATTGTTRPAPKWNMEAFLIDEDSDWESMDTQFGDDLNVRTSITGAPVDPEKGRNLDVRIFFISFTL